MSFRERRWAILNHMAAHAARLTQVSAGPTVTRGSDTQKRNRDVGQFAFLGAGTDRGSNQEAVR
jgi:hypothetical protein